MTVWCSKCQTRAIKFNISSPSDLLKCNTCRLSRRPDACEETLERCRCDQLTRTQLSVLLLGYFAPQLHLCPDNNDTAGSRLWMSLPSDDFRLGQRSRAVYRKQENLSTLSERAQFVTLTPLSRLSRPPPLIKQKLHIIILGGAGGQSSSWGASGVPRGPVLMSHM